MKLIIIPNFAFAGAPRYHTGGIPGLRSDEVPTILQKGEWVLSRSQVAAIKNMPNGGDNTIVNIAIENKTGLSLNLKELSSSTNKFIDEKRKIKNIIMELSIKDYEIQKLFKAGK